MSPSSRKSPSRRRSTPTAKFVKRYQRVEDLPVVHRHAAGIDLAGAASHFVAVEVGEEIEVREFGGTTDEVRALVAYLGDQGVTTVAMEATGVYWMVVYDLLEVAGLEVFLVNQTHVKAVPGRRKDDKLDCRWLQKLHKYGLLSASFRPSPEDRPLQSFYRQRTRLIRLAADELRRMHQALDVMNVRIHTALSDLAGVTGMRIVRAIVAGERDPAVLATFRDPRCACTPEELQAALTGHYLPQQVVALTQALARYDLLTAQLTDLDGEIETTLTQLLPFSDAEVAAQVAATPRPPAQGKHAPAFPVTSYLYLLTGQDATQLPGIAAANALGLQAEIGRDLTKWPTVKHFTSYLTLAPVPKISGGKRLSSRTRPGVHPAAVIFKQAAAAVSRTDTALGAFYRRLAVRVGSGKALVATARKIAEQYYYLMRYGQAYVEVGAQQEEERYRQRQIAAVTKRAQQLGLTVSLAA
ncbi:MAG: IS110 family RNA-guided transposase [Armatimonadota bacterium]